MFGYWTAALPVLLSAVQAVVHLITGEALLHVGRDQLLLPHTWCLILPPSIVRVKANADCGFVLRYVGISRVDVLALRMLAMLLKCVSCYKFRYLLTLLTYLLYLLTYFTYLLDLLYLLTYFTYLRTLLTYFTHLLTWLTYLLDLLYFTYLLA